MTAESAAIDEILRETRTIAVVGLSSNPNRPSNEVAMYLRGNGYRIIPVNPSETEVLGEKAYGALEDVPESVDTVQVFRRPEFAPEIAQDAVRIGAKVLWLQDGVVSEEAKKIAEEGGLRVVMDDCMARRHRRLRGTG